MTRASAIVIQEDQIALILRKRDEMTYYIFPGGQVEQGEIAEEALRREIREELGLWVSPVKLVARVNYRGEDQFFYRVKVTGGEFGTGQGPEMQGLYDPTAGTFEAVWLPVNQLLEENVLPRVMAELIYRASQSGWPDEAVKLIDPGL